MQAFIEIFKGELGSSVRGKLNRYLSSIVSGSEGINAIWNTISDLRAEMQSLDGGVGGLITDASYDPSDLDPYKSATLIALGKGTFTHFKDSNGQPITITQDNSFTIFFREAGDSYWRYTTTVIAATIDTKAIADISELSDLPAVGLAKDGKLINVATNTDAVYDNKREGTLSMNLHKLFSVAKGFVRPEELDSYYYQTGYYVVTNMDEGIEDVLCVGLLEVFSEGMQHMAYQRLTINCNDPNVSYIEHSDNKAPITWERKFNINSPYVTDPARGTWSKWVPKERLVEVTKNETGHNILTFY